MSSPRVAIYTEAIAELKEQIEKSNGVGVQELFEKLMYANIALMEEAIAEVRALIVETEKVFKTE